MQKALFFIVFIVSCYYFWPVDKHYEYSDMSVLPDYDNMKCIATGNNVDLEIKVIIESVEEDQDYIGRWYPRHNTIGLVLGKGNNIDTIAHEVYHMVQDKKYELRFDDSHLEAYMQGFWTECVAKLVANTEYGLVI